MRNRRNFAFFALVGAASIALSLSAAILLLAAMNAYAVQVLLETGSDPARALSQMSPDTATALLDYAIETQNSLALEYLAKYRTDPTSGTVAPSPPAAR